jgi:hypothetical protein
MRRHFLNFATAVSLVLCMATVVLWLGSYWWAGGVSVAGRWAVSAGEGKLSLHYQSKGAPPDHPRVAWNVEDLDFSSIGLLPVFVPLTHTSAATSIHYWQYLVPAWLPAAAFALPPALWLQRRRKRSAREQRRDKGLCVACGYDLRGSAALCPECGSPIERAAASPAA